MSLPLSFPLFEKRGLKTHSFFSASLHFELAFALAEPLDFDFNIELIMNRSYLALK